MPLAWDVLRQAVLAELRRQRELATPKANPRRGKLFGQFLRYCLMRRGISDQEFAARLDIEQELANAILEGILPESEMGDEFLAEISKIIDYDPGILKE